MSEKIKEKAKEPVQPEITVEQLQTENGALKDRVAELETENADLKTKITELSAEEIDSSSFRKVDKDGNVKIKILLAPAGRWFLPYNVGQVVSHPANQADEMVELKYAEYVK